MLKSILKRYQVRFSILRAVVSNYRESAARSINSHFFFFHQNKHFGKLFSKTVFKSSSEAPFMRKNRFETIRTATKLSEKTNNNDNNSQKNRLKWMDKFEEDRSGSQLWLPNSFQIISFRV